LHEAKEVVAKIEIIRHMKEEKISPAGFTESETPYSAPRPSQRDAHETAKQATQAAQTEIQKLKGAAREQGSAAVEELKTAAQSAAREAQEAGRDFVHEQKENLAQRVHNYAEALRSASERLRNEEGNVLAEPAQKGAEQLERLVSYLREKEPGDFLEDLEAFTRRRPEVVFGGLFVVGLAAARFFKASRRRPRRAGSAEPIGDAGALQLATPSSAPIAATTSESVSAAPAFAPAPSSSLQVAPTSKEP
jgi:hypothetical protein